MVETTHTDRCRNRPCPATNVLKVDMHGTCFMGLPGICAKYHAYKAPWWPSKALWKTLLRRSHKTYGIHEQSFSTRKCTKFRLPKKQFQSLFDLMGFVTKPRFGIFQPDFAESPFFATGKTEAPKTRTKSMAKNAVKQAKNGPPSQNPYQIAAFGSRDCFAFGK